MSSRSISTTQLAKICGVSQGTVDRALNNRKGIRPDTREKILAAAKEYGYRPNIHARSLSGGKSMLIGVVVFHLYNQYFSDLLTVLTRQLTARDYAPVVMLTDKDPTREIACIRQLEQMAVDGIVLCPVNRGEEFENFLLSLQTPVVTVGNRLQRFPHVGIDDRLAMEEATQYALGKGYDRLIYVQPALGDGNAFAQDERRGGFLAAAQGRCSLQLTDAAGAEGCLVPGKKNAFLCSTDRDALALLPVARAHGAGIMGFDGLRLLEELQIPLDTVAYDLETAAAAVTAYLADGRLPADVVPHRSVRRGSL